MLARHGLVVAGVVLASSACADVGLEEKSGRAAASPSASPPGSVEAAAPRELVIASYNVFYGNAAKGEGAPRSWADADTLAVAAGMGADILAFQETNEAWAGALTEVLAKELPHCRFHEPVKFLPEGLGVCSRYPIVSDEIVPSAVGWFPAQRTVVETPNGDIEILNVHLKPAVAGVEDWWDVHEATRPDRVREMNALLPKLMPNTPTFVVGDFNDVIEGDVFATLQKAGVANVFKEMPVKQASWEWAGAEPPLAALLDHVAYDRAHFKPIEAKVVPGGRSDHRAVVARFAY